MSAVIAGIYDFTLSHTGCGVLEYKDESIWMEGPQYDEPSSYILKITDPGGGEHQVQVSAIAGNKITAEELGYGSCFPSGIYCFSVVPASGAGGKGYTKKGAVMCAQYCGLQKAISQLRPGDDGDRVRRVRDYIEYAENASAHGNENLAQEWIGLIDIELKKLNCECNCV